VRVGTLSRADVQPPRPRLKRPPPMPQQHAPADAPLTQTLPLFPDDS
jgi:DNA polymerase-4